MRITEYLKDKLLLLTLQAFCMLLLTGFLHATGYKDDYILLLLIFWILILSLWLGYGYAQRKRYFKELEETMARVERRYLLGELMPDSYRLEDRLYRELIRASNKSVIERIRRIEEEKKEYREYIESWVHEIKTPITSIALMCENYREQEKTEDPPKCTGRDMARRVRLENQKIENYVDMALYYAKSDDVYKDYLIRETSLQEIAVVVLKRNKHYLIQNQVQAEVDCRESAYTDGKWVSFILHQLVLNSAKYRRSEGARIWIYTEKDTPRQNRFCVRLIVEDNGIGIKEDELSRIFEKGFTGSNGRKGERSTGMGLYLCEKLCRKLGIKIYAYSKEGEGAKMTLEFPVSTYLTEAEEGSGE